MPNYEYRCLDCHRRFDILMTYSEYEHKQVKCPHCDSPHIQRKIGRVRVAHSSESQLENMADPDNLAGLEDDPRSLGKMMRNMSSELGEDMGPEFNEVVGRLESGETPDQIEKSMPDLGAESPGGVGMGDFGGLDE